MDETALAIVLAALCLVGVALVLAVTCARVVPAWAKMVVYRWGIPDERLVREPGLRFVIPIADRGVMVDLREQSAELPRQSAVTKDQAAISVDLLVCWKIVDPLTSQMAVINFAGALQRAAGTTLRSVVGEILLKDVLSQRERIGETLRTQLDETTQRWGGKVTRVEIREIQPPPAAQDAEGSSERRAS